MRRKGRAWVFRIGLLRPAGRLQPRIRDGVCLRPLKRNEALALPRRDAIWWLASRVGTVVTVTGAPSRPDRRARDVPISDPQPMACTPHRVPRRATDEEPR